MAAFQEFFGQAIGLLIETDFALRYHEYGLIAPFVFAVISPIIARQTKVDRCAVDGIQRIFELEFMFWSDCIGLHLTFLRFFQNDIGV